MLERLAARALDELAYRLGPRMAYPVEPLQRVSRWALYVTPQVAIEGAASAQQTLTSAPLNLLSFDRPTLMQEWRLRRISLPIGVFVKQGAGEHVNQVVTVTARLRVAGDEVYSAAGETGRGGTVHALTLSDTFAEPIVLTAGQTLTLELAASCYEAAETLEVAYGRLSATGALESLTGVLRYDAVAYSGRRSL